MNTETSFPQDKKSATGRIHLPTFLSRERLYPWAVLLAVAGFLTGYLAVLHPWMNRWGALSHEISAALPGDSAASGMQIASTRGVSIQAPPEQVWPWVVQLGQERAGFYSNDWLENLALADIHNADQLRPEWQTRRLGDKVFGAGGSLYKQDAFWRIGYYEAGRALYLWGPIVVLPDGQGGTRLLARSFTAPQTPGARLLSAFTYDWIHFVMERGMLLGIKARAEGAPTSAPIGRRMAALGWVVAGVLLGGRLFLRRRGWWWSGFALAYAVSIGMVTHDAWSALAGFLWWGAITVGFLVRGRAWWFELPVVTAGVILLLVLAEQPWIAFGWVFLLVSMALFAFWLTMYIIRKAVSTGDMSASSS